MYEIVPTSEPVETGEPDIKYADRSLGAGDTNSNNMKDKLNLNCHKAPVKAVRNSFGEDSGFDDLFESDATEKTGLLSDISDSLSPDTAQLDQDSPINGIDGTGVSNYHDYATALTDVRNEVDKKEICKKKKVRINEDVTDISLIPDRFEYCVNYKNGYNGYKHGVQTDRKNNTERNNKSKCYYRYCFDTQNSGRHHTAMWEEGDERFSYHSHENSTKKQSGDVNVKITLTDTTEPYTTEEESRVIHPSSDPTDSPPGRWPLKRSQSVDSRDNPFLPGGDLEKEAEEILSRATIIRDKFILKDTDKVKSEHNPSSSHAKFESNAVPEVGSNALPVEETVTAEVNKMAESVPNARPKVNGQVTESEDSLTPGSVKMELTEENKDKKKQKKCCTIM